jgi:glycosyltransferase involved in cell wall biosynthesis
LAPRDVLVSVLLPVRDAQRTLVECLRSLSLQTQEDHEVIAVDDGSSDRTLEILRAFASGDSRLRVLATPPRGIAPALNAALSLARGDLVARMDADDFAHPERLRIQAARLREDPRTEVLGCRVRLRSSPGQKNAGMGRYVSWLNGLLDHESIVRDIFVESPLAHPSVMMRTPTLRDLGGYREFSGPEDYDLWLRAHARGLRFAKVKEVLVSWRDSPERLSRNDPRYGHEPFLLAKLSALEAGLLKARRGVVLWGAGPIGKGWSRALRGRGHLVLAFVEVDPRKIGRTIHGVPVLGVGEASCPGALHLAAVGRPGARDLIRREARRLGLIEGTDIVAVA